MKQALLIITCFTLSLGPTMASNLDTNPNNWPETITMTNKMVPTAINGVQANLGGEWTKYPAYTSEGNITYKKSYPDGSYSLYQISSYGPDSPIYAYLNHYDNEENQTELWNVDWSGESLDQMVLGGTYGNSSMDAYFEENRNFFSNMAALVCGGLNEAGTSFLTGGDPGPDPQDNGQGSTFYTQAQEITKGLIFQDGQWAPAP
jgi:hypothetical protein